MFVSPRRARRQESRRGSMRETRSGSTSARGPAVRAPRKWARPAAARRARGRPEQASEPALPSPSSGAPARWSQTENLTADSCWEQRGQAGWFPTIEPRAGSYRVVQGQAARFPTAKLRAGWTPVVRWSEAATGQTRSSQTAKSGEAARAALEGAQARQEWEESSSEASAGRGVGPSRKGHKPKAPAGPMASGLVGAAERRKMPPPAARESPRAEPAVRRGPARERGLPWPPG
jgi:hypothetical protein